MQSKLREVHGPIQQLLRLLRPLLLQLLLLQRLKELPQ
jgi:hypothetical protein